MKVTLRMKKILLCLLHSERSTTGQPPNEGGRFGWRSDFDVLWRTRAEYESNLTRSIDVSYQRTFKILRRSGLVQRGVDDYGEYYMRLTDKGKEMAQKIENEIRELTEEYNTLLYIASFGTSRISES